MTRTVRTIWRGEGRSYQFPQIRTVTVGWVCPVCGGPRGEPKPKHFCEDGEWLTCDIWENPCGHVDHYHDVIREEGQAEWDRATSIERVANASPDIVTAVLERLFHEGGDDVRGLHVDRDGVITKTVTR